MALRTQLTPPWIKDGHPEQWIPVDRFALLVGRSPFTVYRWLREGEVLPKFGYRAWQDIAGRWRIQVRPEDLHYLSQIPTG